MGWLVASFLYGGFLLLFVIHVFCQHGIDLILIRSPHPSVLLSTDTIAATAGSNGNGHLHELWGQVLEECGDPLEEQQRRDYPSFPVPCWLSSPVGF